MRIAKRTTGKPARVLAVGVIGAVGMVAAGGVAAAQTGGGSGGPFTSGSVTSVSGSDVRVTSSFSDDEVSVAVDDATTYRKTQETTLDGITTGACVRITGTGSAKKGITAEAISLTSSADEGCDGGVPGGQGGTGGTPPSLPDDLPEGAQPPAGGSAPDGANGPGGQGSGRTNVTTAFGTVKKVTDTGLVVKAAILGRPSDDDDQPRVTTKRVTVKVGDDTTITETVDAAVVDVTVGLCVTASGVGDAEAFTAEQVTVSQPDDQGECTGMGGGMFFPGGGGGFPGGGSPPTTDDATT